MGDILVTHAQCAGNYVTYTGSLGVCCCGVVAWHLTQRGSTNSNGCLSASAKICLALCFVYYYNVNVMVSCEIELFQKLVAAREYFPAS